MTDDDPTNLVPDPGGEPSLADVESADETPVYDPETGELRGTMTGLKAFQEGWADDVEMPHQLSFSGWQMVDEEHPAGGGKPGYRLVHKTIRTVPFPFLNIELATMKVLIGNGEVTIGSPVFETALPGRREGEFLVPEWGQVVQNPDGSRGYQNAPDPNIRVRASQETLPPGNFVEILCLLAEDVGDTHAQQVAAGRARIAPMTAMLDLLFGQRLLGPILTEEIGEVYPDWHWNRRLGGQSVGLESQAKLEHLDGNTVVTKLEPALKQFQDIGDEGRQRVRLASQWYWRAEVEPDHVLQFVGYWLVIEALELGENANISPVKNKVAAMLGATKAEVTGEVGKLYSIRNKLLHGKLLSVAGVDVARVRTLAVTLLEVHLFGEVSSARAAELRVALGLPALDQSATVVLPD